MRVTIDLTRYLLTVFLISLAGISFAQGEPADSLDGRSPKTPVYTSEYPSDSSMLTVRMPDEAALDKFRNDRDFQYDRDNRYVKTFWDYVKYYFWKLISRILGNESSTNWLYIIIFILLIAGIILVVVKMLGIDVSGIFYQKPAVKLTGTVFDEDLHHSEYEKMLDDALSTQQFRLAVRILYLLTLRKLVDHGQIQWQPDKTNHSYLNEITSQALREYFSNLTRSYEFVWYGDFDITRDHYKYVEKDFNELSRLMR